SISSNGTIAASNATLSGDVTAQNGIFSNNLSAVNADFRGTVSAQGFIGDGSQLTNLPFPSDMWLENDNGIYYKSGFVGIGTDSPEADLHIFGYGIGQTLKINSLVDGTHNYAWNFINNGDNLIVSFQNNDNPSGYDILNLSKNNLLYDGNIECTSIEVVQEVWKDYVFYPDYNLLSLDSLENFISTNNHLPDIPSEQDIIENGLNLGDMDALLLLKIEELTLYIIEQNKKISELEKQLSTIKAE
ncbi:MAG: hypothetical protein JXR68_11990, partial [Bacteroidales bacterium]|nr:hypothetical protein [Bacteroidales bacterium]